MIALAILHRGVALARQALVDAALFTLFCFGLLLGSIWRWA
ncbi:hypothetical protein [Variovorax paradoxus]|nr:hypothetical protein [Variovorax paradoxus]